MMIFSACAAVPTDLGACVCIAHVAPPIKREWAWSSVHRSSTMEEKWRSLGSKRDRDQQMSGENQRSYRRKEYRELEGRFEGSFRKRPKYEEARTSARPENSDRRDDEASSKRVRHSRSSPRDHVKSGSHHDDRHRRTSAYPYASSGRRRGKDAPDKYGGHSHGRDRYEESPHMNRDRTSFRRKFTHDREREKECNRNRDRSTRRQKLQLPVDGAASQKRCEVVPYASSEASSSSRGHQSVMEGKHELLMKVLSMVDCGFIPSLPEKYYSVEDDKVTTKVWSFIP